MHAAEFSYVADRRLRHLREIYNNRFIALDVNSYIFFLHSCVRGKCPRIYQIVAVGYISERRGKVLDWVTLSQDYGKPGKNISD